MVVMENAYSPSTLAMKIRNRASKDLSRKLLPFFRKPDASGLELTRIGSDYGGWWMPTNILPKDFVAYCVGVGTDASFDFGIAEGFDCKVFSLDPSPQAVEWVATVDLPGNCEFHPVGLWNDDVVLSFYFDRRSAQLSSRDIDGTGRVIELPVKRISTLMREFGHDRIDLLKIDIEGAWREVLEDLIEQSVLPTVLMVEFDSPVSLSIVIRWIDRLRDRGYDYCKCEKDNFLFVLSEHRQRPVSEPA